MSLQLVMKLSKNWDYFVDMVFPVVLETHLKQEYQSAVYWFFFFQTNILPARSFNRLHVPHKMAELALNKSHRYSYEYINKNKDSEYHYLLSTIRPNLTEANGTGLCLAALPSTGTWTFIDCQKKFIIVMFLCEHEKATPI